jgi:Inorganic Pyrophosphatase/ADP-Ribosyltransferase in polyvalent proteins
MIILFAKAHVASYTKTDGTFVAAHEDTRSAAKPHVTSSEPFKKWFGASKVVDASGKPLRLFHGTPDGGFSEFSEEKKGSRTNHSSDEVGFHFTDSAEYADTYNSSSDIEMIEQYREMFGTEPAAFPMPKGSSTYPVYLKIENPLHLERSAQITAEVIKQAKKDGHDGIFASVGDIREYVAFSPNQIKSATGNNGEFSNHPDITKAVLFLKTHIDTYTRKDGSVVVAHEDKRQGAKKKMPSLKSDATDTDQVYMNETIVVNGKTRPTKNSKGDPIAKTKQALINFWNWFGDSEVVDDDGKPLVVYHGTGNDIDGVNFNPKKTQDIGIHFGTENIANVFAGRNGVVYPAYLQAKNVAYTDDIFSMPGGLESALGILLNDDALIPDYEDIETWGELRELAEYLDGEFVIADSQRDLGQSKKWKKFWKLLAGRIAPDVDGLSYLNGNQREGKGRCWVVFNKNQIKSASGNYGSFAVGKDDMTKAIIFLKSRPELHITDTYTPPTQAQAVAGNYKKPRIQWNGLEIAIENPVGSVRKGYGWSTEMSNAYGYIRRTEAADGDEVDVYLGPDLDAPMVYVVHQRKCGRWDEYGEDKCMIGFGSEAAAKAAYLRHYDDPRFLGPITAMPVAEFVEKAKATLDRPAMIKAVLFFKSHVSGYTKKDGTVVKPHEDKRVLSFKRAHNGEAYGQSDHTIHAIHGDKKVGKIDYSVYEGKPQISMVEVKKEHQRKGYGAELVRQLQLDFPDIEIDWGMLTDDGAKLKESMKFNVVPSEYADKLAELKEIIAERDKILAECNKYKQSKNPTVEQKARYNELAGSLNDLHDQIYDLEEETSGKSDVKMLVKTAKSQ